MGNTRKKDLNSLTQRQDTNWLEISFVFMTELFYCKHFSGQDFASHLVSSHSK